MKLLSICTISCAVVLISLVPASTAHAHRSDTAALEEYSRVQGELQRNIQAMQSEMAELRNQLERQQFELSKLRAAPRAASGGYPSDAQPRFVPSDNGLVPAPANTNTANPRLGAPTGATGMPSYTPPTNSFPTTEERVLSPNSAPAASSQFPPVEERQIGGPLSTPAEGSFPPSTGSGPVIVGTPIEAVPTNGGGVIAIPGGVDAPTTNNGVPSPDVASQQATATGDPSNNAIEATLGESELYQQAFELLRQSKHNEAVAVFSQQIADFPYGEYADDANYWIAESKYVNRDLAESKKYFKVIIEQYKQSPRLPDAMLKTAYIEQEQGNKIEARILLQEILQYHPRSNAAISAKNRLAELGT